MTHITQIYRGTLQFNVKHSKLPICATFHLHLYVYIYIYTYDKINPVSQSSATMKEIEAYTFIDLDDGLDWGLEDWDLDIICVDDRKMASFETEEEEMERLRRQKMEEDEAEEMKQYWWSDEDSNDIILKRVLVNGGEEEILIEDDDEDDDDKLWWLDWS